MAEEKSSERIEEESGLNHPVTDLAVGLFLAASSLIAVFWLFPNYIVTGIGENDVGPRFFPQLAAWLVFGLSVLLIFSSAKRMRLQNTGTKGFYILLEIAIWATISLLVLLGLQNIGFLITAPWIIVLGAIACWYRKWWLIVVLAIVTPLIIYQAAELIFGVILP